MNDTNTAIALENLSYFTNEPEAVSPDALTIQITGDVQKPGRYPIKGGASLSLYLHDAGVQDIHFAENSVIIIRAFGADKRSLVYSLKEPEALPRPKAGDFIIVNHDKSKRKSRQDIPHAFGSPSLRRVIGRKVDSLTDITEIPATETEAPKTETIENTEPPQDGLDAVAPQLPTAVARVEPPALMLPAATAEALVAYAKKSHTKRLLNLLAERQAATGAKSFAIVSPLANDGRSFFCATMSISYALLLDSKVMILDCSSEDENSFLIGIPALISAEQEERELGHASVTVVKAHTLRRTKKDDIDFAIRNFIAEKSADYDLILVDTAPISHTSPFIDPVIAAAQADGTLVILREASQEQQLLNSVSKMLKQHSVNVVGVVTNSIHSQN